MCIYIYIMCIYIYTHTMLMYELINEYAMSCSMLMHEQVN